MYNLMIENDLIILKLNNEIIAKIKYDEKTYNYFLNLVNEENHKKECK